CAAVTTEFENVNADAMRELAKTTRVSPSGDCVAIAQDRIVEKSWINKAGLPTAPYLAIESVEDIQVDLAPYLPGILKTARLGYDGKGQVRVKTAAEARAAYANLGGQACVLEKMLDLKLEVSA
ncbi:ATP-grasp domain-containing protein, partial (plasmid) [Chromobacterium amazonense]